VGKGGVSKIERECGTGHSEGNSWKKERESGREAKLSDRKNCPVDEDARKGRKCARWKIAGSAIQRRSV